MASLQKLMLVITYFHIIITGAQTACTDISIYKSPIKGPLTYAPSVDGGTDLDMVTSFS